MQWIFSAEAAIFIFGPKSVTETDKSTLFELTELVDELVDHSNPSRTKKLNNKTHFTSKSCIWTLPGSVSWRGWLWVCRHWCPSCHLRSVRRAQNLPGDSDFLSPGNFHSCPSLSATSLPHDQIGDRETTLQNKKGHQRRVLRFRRR